MDIVSVSLHSILRQGMLNLSMRILKYSTIINEFIDAIKHIELMGLPDYLLSQNSSLAFHVDGR